jgi:putative PIN family toxin of toxin-antitoxin system
MLDTNILISAFIFKSETMNRLIYKLSRDHEIVICSYTIEELKILSYSKFKIDIKVLYQFLEEFPFELVYSPECVEKKLFNIRDENDYIILHTAIVENIDVFITGDKDFFDIEIDRPEIMTVNEFLNKY